MALYPDDNLFYAEALWYSEHPGGWPEPTRPGRRFWRTDWAHVLVIVAFVVAGCGPV